MKWHLFSDGHWEGEREDGGANGPPPPAGWGVVELTVCEPPTQTLQNLSETLQNPAVPLQVSDRVPIAPLLAPQGPDWSQGAARVTWADSDMVEESPVSPFWLGALAQTNNTGELSGMHYMIRRARQRPRGSGGEDLWSDSLYAIHMTTGKWMPKCTRNVEFIRNLRRDWRALQRHRPGECRLRHVRSHTKVPGNEIADWLAERGAANRHECASSAAKWATDYLQEQYEALRRRHPPPPPSPACARGGAGPPNTLWEPRGVG